MADFSPSLVGRQKTDPTDITLLTENNFPVGGAVFEAPAPEETVKCNFYTVPSNTNPVSEIFDLGTDYTQPLTYIRYGSAEDLFMSSLEGIYMNYPYSVYARKAGSIFNILNYSFDSDLNIAVFEIPAKSLIALDDTIYTERRVGTNPNAIDITSSFEDFEVYLPPHTLDALPVGTADSYPIVSYEGTISEEAGYATVSVRGNPFEGLTGNLSYDLHIRPKRYKYDEFTESLSDFQKFIIGTERGTDNIFRLNIPYRLQNGGVSYAEDEFTLPFTDGNNPDISGVRFETLAQGLSEAGRVYDSTRTDIYYRCLIPSTLRDLNESTGSINSDGKPDDSLLLLLRSFGRVFDEYSRAIDSVSQIFKVGFGNKAGQAPIRLLPELGKLFGIEYFDLVKARLDETTDYPVDIAGINISLWRNILADSAYLLGARSTRKPIEFLFRFMGLPEEYYVIDEFVYSFDKPISLINDFRSVDSRLVESPYGLANAPLAFDGIHFESDDYFQIYRRLGYSFDRLTDNTKSYSDTSGYPSRSFVAYNGFGSASLANKTVSLEYTLPFVANTKDLVVGIDPFKAIEASVYEMNTKNLRELCGPDCDAIEFVITGFNDISEFPEQPNISDNIITYYPLDLDASQLSFGEYVNTAISNSINPRNRKVSDGYPKLKSLFNDYYNDYKDDTCLTGTTYGVPEAMEYMSIIDQGIIRIVEQFIPSTSKLLGFGGIVRNTEFARQKFVYKRGVDESSKFDKVQPGYTVDSDAYTLTGTASVGGGYESSVYIGTTDDALACNAPLQPVLNGFSVTSEGTLLYIVEGGNGDTDSYRVERLEQGKCSACDFEFINTGDLFDNTYESSNDWVILDEDFNGNIYNDTTRLAGYGYFYRITAKNQCGESVSDVLFIGSEEITASVITSNAVITVEVYQWDITSYTVPPEPGVFLEETGFVARLSDGLFYPLDTYDIGNEEGLLQGNQVGYLESEVPGLFACGTSQCPNNFNSTLAVVSVAASIEVVA